MNEKNKILEEVLYRLNMSMRIAAVQGGDIELELCPYEADIIRETLRKEMTTVDEL